MLPEKKAINTLSSSADQNHTAKPPSISDEFGGPKFRKYKGGGFDLHFFEASIWGKFSSRVLWLWLEREKEW